MTIPQVIAIAFLALLNGFAIGVVLYRHYVMKPRWETEAELRKELGKVRGELWEKGVEVGNLQVYLAFRGGFIPKPWKVTPAIKTRAHSDVLPFDSIDALIKGTK